MSKKEPKILMWDCEATGLNASFGTLLCIGWKWLGAKRVTVASITDEGKDALDDGPLVRKFAEVFTEADWHVTWYGERYDLPMVRTKLLLHGEPPLPPKPHVDLWKPARKLFKSHSNRLAVWQQLVGAEAAKTPITYDDWRKGGHGDSASLGTIMHHCKMDVLVLEEVFNKMRPWIGDYEPARGLFTGEHGPDTCQSCGSANLERRGYKAAMTRLYAQYRCRDCGRWMRGAKAIGGVEMRSAA